MTWYLANQREIKNLKERAEALGLEVSQGLTQDDLGENYKFQDGCEREGLELINAESGEVIYSPYFAGNYHFAWTVSDLDRYLTAEEAHRYRLWQAQDILDNLIVK